jgi:CheY-like chemotaxis protein
MSGANLVTTAELLSRRILAIDDEEANLLLLSSLLEREGYTDLHCVTDPSKALDAYVEAEPHLVLLDLMMPVVDGYQLLEAFRRQARPDEFRPVIVLTADTAIQARRRALSLGAKDFVTKPFDVVEVALRIANLLETQILYERLRNGKNLLSEGG